MIDLPASDALRPKVKGKFLFLGQEKLYVRGVTYGPFRQTNDQPSCAERIRGDFNRMADHGINAIRTYNLPSRVMLDCAWQHGIRVLAGIPWEQHVAFLNDRRLTRRIERSVADGVRSCARHPALLGYAIGNEIPSAIVRWHGYRQVERFLKRLWEAAKAEDPDGLVTYVNYPSTEYLELPFLDLIAFNVYLESATTFEAYVARLQNLAGDKPLILAETGLDSRRNGEDTQGRLLDSQIRSSFATGCAGLFVFSWTDEWYRGGNDVEDWDFGLTRRNGEAKPSLVAVQSAFGQVPFPRDLEWPRFSVVVCTHNGAATLDECLDGCLKLAYPNFEVLVVNDGSSETVAAIARKHRVQLINLPHSGLSAARNAGLSASTGSIVAYIDDDACPDRHWLQYLAHTFQSGNYAAVGGPNIPPETENRVAQCVANAPGGPAHVLVSDRKAEHIPGCNMAFRREVLEAMGGFDPLFTAAGDDVDICWRLQDRGQEIGFTPGAVVWHHRRQRVRGYWKQQVGYGRAEALLEQKWPHRFNGAGHAAWTGRIYGGKRWSFLSCRRSRIYHGTWGSSLFQSVYQPAPNRLSSIAQMPEWYLIVAALLLLTGLGVFWRPLFMLWPLATVSAGSSVVHVALSARQASLRGFKMRALVGLLHLLQPLARLYGRMGSGLTPWRRLPARGFALPGWRHVTIWSERCRSATEWLESIEKSLQTPGAVVSRGGAFDRWDLELRGGALGTVRMRAALEEHGQGRQLLRIRMWPHWAWPGLLITVISAIVTAAAAHDQAWPAIVIFAATALCCLVATVEEWCLATATILRVVRGLKRAAEAQQQPRSVRQPTPFSTVPAPRTLS